MREVSVEERVRRVIGAAAREVKRKSLPGANRGDVIQRVCLSACQILAARPMDGMCAFVKSRPRPTTRKSGRG